MHYLSRFLPKFFPLPVVAWRFAAEFRCTGPACEDTCCKEWHIGVDEKTLQKYNRAYDLKDITVPTPNGPAMCLDDKDHCVKFEGGLCGIQKKYGEDYLSDTCFFYPRIMREFGGKHIVSMTLSCPETTRLVLFGNENLFELVDAHLNRHPEPIKPFPPGLSPETITELHRKTVQKILDPRFSPERHIMRLLNLADALDINKVKAWETAISGFLNREDDALPPAIAHFEDNTSLLNGIFTLAIQAKAQHRPRFYASLREMELATGAAIHWKDGKVRVTRYSKEAYEALVQSWEIYQHELTPLLRRWLAAQLAMLHFPFTGHGDGLKGHAIVLALCFATMRLALLSACHLRGTMIDRKEQVRIIQGLSRTLDHTHDAEIFFNAYSRPDWRDMGRLRGIIGDFTPR